MLTVDSVLINIRYDDVLYRLRAWARRVKSAVLATYMLMTVIVCTAISLLVTVAKAFDPEYYIAYFAVWFAEILLVVAAIAVLIHGCNLSKGYLFPFLHKDSMRMVNYLYALGDYADAYEALNNMPYITSLYRHWELVRAWHKGTLRCEVCVQDRQLYMIVDDTPNREVHSLDRMDLDDDTATWSERHHTLVIELDYLYFKETDK